MVDQRKTKKPTQAPKGSPQGGARKQGGQAGAAKQGGAAKQAAAKQAAGAKQAAAKQAAGAKQASRGKLVKGAAARREAERRRRQRTLAWTAGVLAVVVALVGIIVWQGRDRSVQLTRPDAATLTAARQAAGCNEVQQLTQAGRNHISPDKQPGNWNSNPPTSGDHLATPLPRGVYKDQQDERAIVHNLEHGYVVIQYKNLPENQLETLTKLAEGLKGQKFVLAPYSGLATDGVALTAWQRLQTCQRADVDVVSGFVNDYMLPGASKSVAPEPSAI
jgi:hypothetical protein